MMNRNDPMQAPTNPAGDPYIADPTGVGRVRESVSALFDGEADELELRRLLTNEQPDAVRDAWRDYQLQRDALQGLDMRFAGLDISAHVQAALADDAMPAVAIGAARWWRPLASVAVAASMATVVVIGARSFNPSFNPNNGFDSGRDGSAVAQVQAPTSINLGRVYPAQINSAVSNVAVGTQSFGSLSTVVAGAQNGGLSELVFPRNDALGRALPGAQTVGFDADQFAQQRLQQYLLRHTERAALNNGQGVIGFAKVSQLNAE
jgi:sigma-E factor negative regulatory protein RseA